MSNKATDFLKRDKSIQSLKKLYNSYLDAVRKPACDKYDFKFQEGSGEGSWGHTPITFQLVTYTGHYGDSSCYQFGSIGDPALYREAFITYLNRNKETILNGLAEILEEGLEEDREKYLNELKAEIERIESTKLPAQDAIPA